MSNKMFFGIIGAVGLMLVSIYVGADAGRKGGYARGVKVGYDLGYAAGKASTESVHTCTNPKSCPIK